MKSIYVKLIELGLLTGGLLCIYYFTRDKKLKKRKKIKREKLLDIVKHITYELFKIFDESSNNARNFCQSSLNGLKDIQDYLKIGEILFHDGCQSKIEEKEKAVITSFDLTVEEFYEELKHYENDKEIQMFLESIKNMYNQCISGFKPTLPPLCIKIDEETVVDLINKVYKQKRKIYKQEISAMLKKSENKNVDLLPNAAFFEQLQTSTKHVEEQVIKENSNIISDVFTYKYLIDYFSSNAEFEKRKRQLESRHGEKMIKILKMKRNKLRKKNNKENKDGKGLKENKEEMEKNNEKYSSSNNNSLNSTPSVNSVVEKQKDAGDLNAELTEEVKVEMKEETKEEVKMETTEETKEEVKVKTSEENKEEVKVETTEDIKEEVKVKTTEENTEEVKVETTEVTKEEVEETMQAEMAEIINMQTVEETKVANEDLKTDEEKLLKYKEEQEEACVEKDIVERQEEKDVENTDSIYKGEEIRNDVPQDILNENEMKTPTDLEKEQDETDIKTVFTKIPVQEDIKTDKKLNLEEFDHGGNVEESLYNKSEAAINRMHNSEPEARVFDESLKEEKEKQNENVAVEIDTEIETKTHVEIDAKEELNNEKEIDESKGTNEVETGIIGENENETNSKIITSDNEKLKIPENFERGDSGEDKETKEELVDSPPVTILEPDNKENEDIESKDFVKENDNKNNLNVNGNAENKDVPSNKVPEKKKKKGSHKKKKERQ